MTDALKYLMAALALGVVGFIAWQTTKPNAEPTQWYQIRCERLTPQWKAWAARNGVPAPVEQPCPHE